MNKKLLMVAMGAALVAAPVLAAQADVTVYGHLHLSLDNYKVDTSSSASTQRSVLDSNSSRFGLKGGEDLGDGLKGIWQVESGAFNAADGSNGMSGQLRNTYVGVSDFWGTVKVGRHDTPMKDLGRKVDLFNEQIGDARTTLGDNGAFDQRISNMVRYESPNMAGFSANVAYGIPECATGNPGCNLPGERTASGDVLWSGGPATVGLGYESDNANGTSESPKIMRLIGQYNMDALVINALYENQRDVLNPSGTNQSGNDRNAWSVGAGYKIANNMLKLQYSKADKSDHADTQSNGSNDNSGKVWALGVDHSLSKSTLVYFAFAKADNGQGTTAYDVSSSIAGHDTNNVPTVGRDGGSSKSYSFGTIVNF